MTEEEARTKWCPMSRVSLTKGEVGYNRVDGGIPSEYATCIGSDCMMWEWAEEEYIFSGGKVMKKCPEVFGAKRKRFVTATAAWPGATDDPS